MPDYMVQRCSDPRSLHSLIRKAIEDYRLNDHSLVAYVAAVFASSVSANLYSVLLGKKNVHTERVSGYSEEISKLTEFIIKSTHKDVSSQITHPDKASW